jgi:hypothetical protein
VLYVTSPSYTSIVETIFEFLPYSLQHVVCHARSSCALAFTQTSCFLELLIPPTDALSTWWFSTVTSTKLTLHGYIRFTRRKLQYTKSLLLCGRHFLTDCLSRRYSDSRPSRGDLKLGEFLFHLVYAKSIHGWSVRNYAHFKSDESFWITLYFYARKKF